MFLQSLINKKTKEVWFKLQSKLIRLEKLTKAPAQRLASEALRAYPCGTVYLWTIVSQLLGGRASRKIKLDSFMKVLVLIREDCKGLEFNCYKSEKYHLKTIGYSSLITFTVPYEFLSSSIQDLSIPKLVLSSCGILPPVHRHTSGSL